MKCLAKNNLFGIIILVVIISFTSSCKKESPIKGKIYGTWRIKRANIHSVYSFRANGSWTASKRVEGKFSKIVENKGKIVGKWELLDPAEGPTSLVMTPVKVESVKDWEEGTSIQFDIVGVDEKELSLIYPNGRKMKLLRVRGTKASVEEDDLGIVKVTTGPIIVNLKRDRAHGKFRYFCIDLELSIEGAEECEYVAIEKKPESEEVTYHFHPKIKEVAIMFFSSLTYKETKTLNKVKEVVENFKTVINPYLNSSVESIYVVKVVVTTNPESVRDFENIYLQTESEDGEDSDAAASD